MKLKIIIKKIEKTTKEINGKIKLKKIEKQNYSQKIKKINNEIKNLEKIKRELTKSLLKENKKPITKHNKTCLNCNRDISHKRIYSLFCDYECYKLNMKKVYA